MTISTALDCNIDNSRDDKAAGTCDALSTYLDNYGVNVATVGSMNERQLLCMADACRFLSNNLPPDADA